MILRLAILLSWSWRGVLGFLLLCNASRAAAELPPPRPNIVVILCDDLGYGDLGCYGHPHIETPRLDRLAADGVRLTACYSAAPVCSPSRVGLLTGRSPNRAGVYDWIPPAGSDRPDARQEVHMRRAEVTIPQLLKQAGYATCQAGKWHCNSRFNAPQQPQPGDFGFDHWFATQNNAAPSHHDPRNFVRNGTPVGPLEGYSCQLVIDEVVTWLDAQTAADPEQPFFVFAAFHEPHEPIASPDHLVEEYLAVARNENEASYFANVENVDRAVGRLLDHLEELGRLDNTLVFFTSDNGPETLNRYGGAERSYGRPGPLRGMKLWTTDGGVRVAGIAYWPDHIEGGGQIDEPVWSPDLLPTFCELAGAQPPQARVLDGVSLVPLIDGQGLRRQRPLFWCYYNALNEQRVAIRHGPWKMLARLDGGKLPRFSNVHPGNRDQVMTARLTDHELYRITDDIGEGNNVIDTVPREAEDLKRRLAEIYRELVTNPVVWQPRE